MIKQECTHRQDSFTIEINQNEIRITEGQEVILEGIIGLIPRQILRFANFRGSIQPSQMGLTCLVVRQRSSIDMLCLVLRQESEAEPFSVFLNENNSFDINSYSS